MAAIRRTFRSHPVPARRLAAFLILLVTSVLGCRDAAAAAEDLFPSLAPRGHWATIRAALFGPDGSTLISAGYDKTALVWDRSTGTVARSLHWESGDGEHGRVHALALSPDGQVLAVAGFMGAGHGSGDDLVGDVLLFEPRRGRLLARLRGHDNVVNGLSFSPDGGRLVSGSADGAVIVWDVAGRESLLRLVLDDDQRPVSAVRFSRDGRKVIVAGLDASVRSWDATTGTATEILEDRGGELRGMDVSARGLVATVGQDRPDEIRLVTLSGAMLPRLRAEGVALGPLAFTPDGTRLLSGDLAPPYRVRIWNLETGREEASYGGHDEAVTVLAVSPDGLDVVSGGGASRRLDVWKLATRDRGARLAGLGVTPWSVGFSDDGAYLAWGHGLAQDSPVRRGPLEWQLRLPGPARADGRSAAGLGAPGPIDAARTFVRGTDASGPRRLRIRPTPEGAPAARLEIVVDGQVTGVVTRDAGSGYDHRAVTFDALGTSAVSGGSNGALARYGLDGRQIGPGFVGHQGDVWAVAISPDNSMLASAGADETIRLWNLATGELVASLFQSTENAWIIWTPQGEFASSPDGDQLIGWHVNKGPDAEAAFITAAQARGLFYQPAAVERALRQQGAKAALTTTAEARPSLASLRSSLPPRFTVARGTTLSDGAVPIAELALELDDPVDRPREIAAFVNGRSVAQQTVRETGDLVLRLPIEEKHNTVRLVLTGRSGLIEERTVEVAGQARSPSAKPTVPRGRLFVVAIGVNNYPKLTGLDLNFAAQDARAVLDEIRAKTSRLYTETIFKLLASPAEPSGTSTPADGPPAEPPTADNVEDAMGLFRDATPDDTVILFLAGHGVNADDSYYFLPETAAMRPDGRWQPSSIVEWSRLQSALLKSKGRRILVVDTCHAAGAYNQRLFKDASDASVVVLAATNADTLSYERRELHHGIFTHAFLQALNGGIEPRRGDGSIRILELATYLDETVERLSGGKQRPSFSFSNLTDFVFAQR